MGVFFLPFNSFEGYKYVGEFAKDSSILFFIPIPLLFLLGGKFWIPINFKAYQIFLVFVLWVFISMVLNSFNSYNFFLKGISGYTRFFRQVIALLISAFYLFAGYYMVLRNLTLEKIFYNVRKVIFISFVFVSIYAMMEFMVLRLNLSFLEEVLKIFDVFPFTEVHLDYRNRRLSSVTFETPALSTYLLSIAGWMFSYIVTGKGIEKYLPGLIVVFLCVFSGSRSSLFIIVFQLLIFVWILLKENKYRNHLKKILVYATIFGLLVSVTFGKKIYGFISEKVTSFSIQDDQLSVSNKSRLGTYVALWEIFLENPLGGVGFSQQAFLARDKYPSWAVENNWEFRDKYLNEEHRSFPPGYNLYLRLLAETGIVGFIIFIFFLYVIYFECSKILKSSNRIEQLLGLILMVSMVGFIMNWFKMDTFRVYGFWISLAILAVIKQKMNGVKN